MASSKKVPFAVPDWPATMPKLLPLREIIPYERNPRVHPPEQITKLAALMRAYGVDQPIVVDEEGVILKGHGRLEAAHEAGFETFPVVRHVGLTEAEKRAIRIADNQVALLSSWNPELLRGEYGYLKVEGFDMPMLGFDATQLRGFGIDVVPLDGMPALTDAAEPEFQQMTFVLHRKEVPGVLKAIKAARGSNGDSENKNKNGVALARICKAFLRGKR